MTWRKFVEHTGEVSIIAVADNLDIPVNDILYFVKHEGHGARFVGGISYYLIWKEDAEEIERRLKVSRE